MIPSKKEEEEEKKKSKIGGSAVKNLPANVGDLGLIPGLGRLPGEGNGNPLQYSCLGNPMDREPGGKQFIGSQKSQK